jgi:hypothetical protein
MFFEDESHVLVSEEEDIVFDSEKQKRMNVAEITCSASNLDEKDED